MSGATLATALGVGQPQLSRLETGKAKITATALERLVTALGIPESDARKLDELRRRSAEPGWWQDYGDILSAFASVQTQALPPRESLNMIHDVMNEL